LTSLATVTDAVDEKPTPSTPKPPGGGLVVKDHVGPIQVGEQKVIEPFD